jgi:hypothetical protein
MGGAGDDRPHASSFDFGRASARAGLAHRQAPLKINF